MGLIGRHYFSLKKFGYLVWDTYILGSFSPKHLVTLLDIYVHGFRLDQRTVTIYEARWDI
jgi:hypothetical protein